MATTWRPGHGDLKDLYYELRPAPGKGIGAFAIKDIKIGTVVLIDTPLFILPRLGGIDSTFVQASYNRLTPEQRQIYDAMPVHYVQSGMPDLFGKFCSNQFGLSRNRCGVYANASRINHSCRPNCANKANRQDQMVFTVIEHVAKGEELVFAYNAELTFMLSSQRRRVMGDYLNQPCKCQLCSAAAQEREFSDLRRNLIRRLLIFLRICDPTPNETPIPSSTSMDMNTHAHDYAIESGWAPWVLLHLAEAEGIIHSDSIGATYGLLLETMLRKKVDQLSTINLADIRRWLSQAETYKRLGNYPTLDHATKSSFDRGLDMASAVLDRDEIFSGDMD